MVPDLLFLHQLLVFQFLKTLLGKETCVNEIFSLDGLSDWLSDWLSTWFLRNCAASVGECHKINRVDIVNWPQKRVSKLTFCHQDRNSWLWPIYSCINSVIILELNDSLLLTDWLTKTIELKLHKHTKIKTKLRQKCGIMLVSLLWAKL